MLSLLALALSLQVKALVTPEFRQFVYKNSKHLYLTDDEIPRLIATEPISPGESVMVMDAVFTLSSFDSFPLYDVVSDAPYLVPMMVRLLHERFQASGFVHQYLKLYPAQQYCFANWTDSEITNLNQRKAFGHQLHYPIEVKHSYGKYMKEVHNLGLPETMTDWEHWKWAACVCTSKAASFNKSVWKQLRKFPVNAGDDKVVGWAIMPLLDLPRHWPRPLDWEPTNQIFVQPGVAYLTSDREFVPGQEFVYSYSSTGNDQLLANHGVVLERNPFNDFFVDVYKVEECEGQPGPSGECKYKVNPRELNEVMLRHFSKTWSPTEALRRYRDALGGIYFKESLRSLRRAQLSEPKEDLARRYLVAEHLTYLEHLKIVDRALLNTLLTEEE